MTLMDTTTTTTTTVTVIEQRLRAALALHPRKPLTLADPLSSRDKTITSFPRSYSIAITVGEPEGSCTMELGFVEAVRLRDQIGTWIDSCRSIESLKLELRLAQERPPVVLVDVADIEIGRSFRYAGDDYTITGTIAFHVHATYHAPDGAWRRRSFTFGTMVEPR